MSDFIPEELVVDILSRLPTKSLIRFRQCIKGSPPEEIKLEHRKLFIDAGEEDTNTIDEYLEIPCPLKSRRLHFYSLMGYVKGLFCVFEQDNFFLWNPSIRKSISLPKPGITKKTHGTFVDYLGFGFDSRSNDYKLVRIVDLCGIELPVVEVYSLNAGLWQVSSGAGGSFPPGFYIGYCSGSRTSCLKGAIHWAAQARVPRDVRLVLSFDLSDEVFKTISLPSDLASARFIIEASVFGGLLSLICHDNFIRENKSCSIWIMKEYGKVDSWYKYVKIDLTGGINGVIGIRKNGHILLEGEKPRPWELSSYDPRNKEIKKLGIKGTAGFFHANTYEENLILLNKTEVSVSSRGWRRKRKDRHCIKGSPPEEIKLEHYKLFIDASEEGTNTFDEFQEIPFPLKSRRLHFYFLMGYVKGLFCVFEQDSYFFWNPSIRKSIGLPKPGITKKTHGSLVDFLGFGFDSRSNDYKLVRVVSLSRTKPSEMEEVNLVEIYSLNAGLWKVSSRAGDSFPPGYYLETPSAYLKGAIHWAAEPLRHRIDAVVLSFDLSDEVFKTISLPSDLASASDMETSVVWGSLSLICEDTFDRANKSCSIWIMKEYGVVDSWYKYVKIDLTGGIKGVIGIRNNGHILLEGDKPRHWELSSYDPRSKEVKLLGINGTIGHFSVDAYEENLVLLNKTDVPVSRRGWSRKRKDRTLIASVFQSLKWLSGLRRPKSFTFELALDGIFLGSRTRDLFYKIGAGLGYQKPRREHKHRPLQPPSPWSPVQLRRRRRETAVLRNSNEWRQLLGAPKGPLVDTTIAIAGGPSLPLREQGWFTEDRRDSGYEVGRGVGE
ncbi:hypothetical protein Vadar_014591 [Vaccinium darrowii]|uniref:Uncharacterized protein n=1 Tax=Vaccinium darrowii TaxID=229202 RepID=A0ACB7X0U1_9ERIC|nr:hypothetical protein Vadar_014591 [Vaccinium darrowii]